MSKPIILSFLSATFLLATLVSGDDSSRVSVPTSGASDGPPILDLAVGNYWIYLDSSWESGIIEATYDTFRVVDHEEDSLGHWWVLDKPMFDLGTRLMVKGETLYTRQTGWEYVPYAEREYIPPADYPTWWYVCRGGDMLHTRFVVPLDSAVTVPAGSFEGVWRYEFEAYCESRATEYFKRGVGFIYVEKPCFDKEIRLPMKHSWLVEYEVGQ